MTTFLRPALFGLAAAGALALAAPAATAMPVTTAAGVSAPVTQVSWPCGPYKHLWRGYCVWNRPVGYYYAPPPPPVVFGWGWGHPWGWRHHRDWR
ncbi:MAG: hypothetical protein KGI57_06860 [Hyphomicrobiales bacterium]|nr:hypothetical protein [Hyphomicrobiales bacterium]MDE2017407.1 hypothetical protein [Hyphomicrobiales bacterium]